MRKMMFFIGLFLLLASPAAADDVAEIKSVIEECYVNGAFNGLDPDAMQRGFHEDFAIYWADGEAIGGFESIHDCIPSASVVPRQASEPPSISQRTPFMKLNSPKKALGTFASFNSKVPQRPFLILASTIRKLNCSPPKIAANCKTSSMPWKTRSSPSQN